jgi:CBS domain-containing protein
MIKAKDIMQTNLITVNEQTCVYEAVDILTEKKITGLPVVNDQGGLVGIISEKDILLMAYHKIVGTCDEAMNSRKITDVMTSEVVSFRSEDNLADVCQCFMDYPFRRVPILDDDGKLVGLISRKDVVSFAFYNEKETANQA